MLIAHSIEWVAVRVEPYSHGQAFYVLVVAATAGRINVSRETISRDSSQPDVVAVCVAAIQKLFHSTDFSDKHPNLYLTGSCASVECLQALEAVGHRASSMTLETYQRIRDVIPDLRDKNALRPIDKNEDTELPPIVLHIYSDASKKALDQEPSPGFGHGFLAHEPATGYLECHSLWHKTPVHYESNQFETHGLLYAMVYCANSVRLKPGQELQFLAHCDNMESVHLLRSFDKADRDQQKSILRTYFPHRHESAHEYIVSILGKPHITIDGEWGKGHSSNAYINLADEFADMARKRHERGMNRTGHTRKMRKLLKDLPGAHKVHQGITTNCHVRSMGNLYGTETVNP